MRESTPERPSVRARSRFRSLWRSRRWGLSEKTEPRPAPQRSRLILAGSAAYLVLIFGVMLWRGISIEPEWVVLALLLIAIAPGRGRSFVIEVLLMCVLAVATSLFFPCAPPWYQFPGEVVKVKNQTVSALSDGQYFFSAIYNSFNPYRFAAFPSLHAAFPALAAAYAWTRYKALAVGLILWSLAVLLSIVYLGEHYVVDALDGYVYVAVAMAIVELVSGCGVRRATKPATPSA